MSVRKPWWRSEKRCWYVWNDGVQVRLDPDEQTAYRLWHLLALEVSEEGPTVGQLIASYLPTMPEVMCAEAASGRRYVLRQFVGKFSARRASALAPAEVAAWVNSHEGWSQSYRWSVGSAVRVAFGWALKKGLLKENKLASLELPGCQSRGADAVIGRETHELLLGEAPRWAADVLAALYQTGCRPGEVCAVEAGDFDERAETWTLGKHKTLRKTQRPRVVYLSGVMIRMSVRLAAAHPSGPLFRNSKGRPVKVKSLARWVYRACGRLGVKAISYGYRHTLATDLLAEGVPDAHVAEILGHKGTRMLHRHYSHLSGRPDVMRGAIGRVRQ